MKILITGSSGFIGAHLTKTLVATGHDVYGVDNMNKYYCPTHKWRRHWELCKGSTQTVSDMKNIDKMMEDIKPEVVIHLAAQAGVRYSIENPRAYLDTNINGTFEVLEAIKKHRPVHTLIASTSSVYGNRDGKFKETDKADEQVSFYAASKKATENMAHVYSHQYDLDITMMRFFTVYGPYGRPDMALFKFVEAIKAGKPIDVYGHGMLDRDYTYIDDVVESIRRLMVHRKGFNVVNIGNNNPVRLIDFIETIEEKLGMEGELNLMPLQDGDVTQTCSDSTKLYEMTGYKPKTTVEEGIEKFIEWHNRTFQ